MILSDKDIAEAIKSGKIIVDPPPTNDSYSTSSVDFHAGNDFMRWKKLAKGASLTIELSEATLPDFHPFVEEVKPDEDGKITVPNNAFLLCFTKETLGLPPASKIAARVEGRSTLARLGLSVHITAPTIHCGFHGPICLEVRNQGPHILRITPGDTPLCQVIFETMSSEPTSTLDTVFQGQQHVLGKKT